MDLLGFITLFTISLPLFLWNSIQCKLIKMEFDTKTKCDEHIRASFQFSVDLLKKNLKRLVDCVRRRILWNSVLEKNMCASHYFLWTILLPEFHLITFPFEYHIYICSNLWACHISHFALSFHSSLISNFILKLRLVINY